MVVAFHPLKLVEFQQRDKNLDQTMIDASVDVVRDDTADHVSVADAALAAAYLNKLDDGLAMMIDSSFVTVIGHDNSVWCSFSSSFGANAALYTTIHQSLCRMKYGDDDDDDDAFYENGVTTSSWDCLCGLYRRRIYASVKNNL